MTPRFLRLLLGGLCGGLTVLVIAEAAFLLPEAGAPRSESAQAAAEDIASLTPSNIDAHIAAILNRPLFSSSRASSEKEDSDDSNDVPAQFGGRLSGVAIDRQDREALFQNDGQKPTAVKPGDTIEGWTVLTIESDHVVLKGRAGEQIIQMTNGSGSARRPLPQKANAARPAPARPAAQNRPTPARATKQAAK